MNRIEETLKRQKQAEEKTLITYMTAGLPDMERMKKIIQAQERAGTDIIELGIPFSDPVADGPVIQKASYEAIQKGVTLKKVFDAVEQMRQENIKIPLIFMMYYNTILHYGIKEFAEKCAATGVDGLIVPDLPLEEQDELQDCLQKYDQTILIQLISPVSKKRIPQILKNARGFVYCVSSMGVTGQRGTFHKEVIAYLSEVKKAAEIPVMMGFGIREAADVAPMKTVIDGAIIGTHFIEQMQENAYEPEAAYRYCKKFKQELNS